MLCRRLERRGFEVVTAVEGEDAIQQARSQSPDMIIMDMSLPLLDGWEATRILKDDEATGSVHVIALTAHAMAGDRERALEAGCDDYETKPVDFKRLLDKIGNVLGPVPDRKR